MIGVHNIKVALMDYDLYALQAVNSYLAWDRRTRVVGRFESHEALQAWLAETPEVERPDVTLYEADWARSPAALRAALESLGDAAGRRLCLSVRPERENVLAADAAGAVGFLVKSDVRIGIAGAIVHSLTHEFVISLSVAEIMGDDLTRLLPHAEVLPGLRRHPGLTERVEQALRLCVIEGMPADLAADEMGVSPHTVRSYVKEGYRVLEAHDDTHFPVHMSPIERAFMRFTALGGGEGDQ